MSNDKDKVELPEGTHTGMFDQTALDGAKAARELVGIITQGEATLEEHLFRRDFLPLLLSREPLTDELEQLFNNAWVAVAGSLQAAIAVTRNGKYAYTVPPILSAHNVTLSDYASGGYNSIRSAIDMVMAHATNATKEQQAAMYQEAVFSKLPPIRIDPVRAEQWRIVLIENGVELSPEKVDTAVSVGESLDGFVEPGEEL